MGRKADNRKDIQPGFYISDKERELIREHNMYVNDPGKAGHAISAKKAIRRLRVREGQEEVKLLKRKAKPAVFFVCLPCGITGLKVSCVTHCPRGNNQDDLKLANNKINRCYHALNKKRQLQALYNATRNRQASGGGK